MRRRADLFAYTARDPVGVGEAATRIDHRQADFYVGLLLRVELFDGPRRANLAAKGAAVLAAADPRDQQRRPETFQTGFQQGRLQSAGQADLHAFAAFHAAPQKIRLRQGPRGPDQRRVGGPGRGQRRHPEKRNGCRPCRERRDDTPPSEIDPAALAGGKTKPDGLRRTEISALHAGNAFARLPAFFRPGPGADRTGDRANAATVAPLADRSFQNGAPGEKTQQRAKGTEVAAPEAPFDDVQSKDSEENQPHEKGLVEARRPEGEERFFQQTVDGLRGIRQQRNLPGINRVEERRHRMLKGRVDRNRQGADQQRKGIEKTGGLEREQR